MYQTILKKLVIVCFISLFTATNLLAQKLNSPQFKESNHKEFTLTSRHVENEIFLVDSSNYPFEFKSMPNQDKWSLYKSSVPIQFSNGKVMIAYQERDSLCIVTSSDSGSTWSKRKGIAKIESLAYDTAWITGIRSISGRAIIIYGSASSSRYKYITYSDDNGITWSTPKMIMSGITASLATRPNISLTSDGTLWVSYHKSSPTMANNIYYRTSTDDGLTWSSEKIFLATSYDEKDLDIISVSSTKIIAAYSDNSSGNYDIYLVSSTDNGISWQFAVPIIQSIYDEENPILLKDSNGMFYLFYQFKSITRFENKYQKDIYFVTSTDNGESWRFWNRLTRFTGDDISPSANIFYDKIFLTFSSTRWLTEYRDRAKIWYGIIGMTNDINPPPNIVSWSNTPFDFGIPIWIQASIDDEAGLTSVHVKYHETKVQMFDDGLHNDGAAGDFIFGASIGPFNYYGDSLKQVFGINNLKIPVDNQGVIANVAVMPVLQYSFTVVDVGTNPNTVEFDGSVAGSTSGGFFDGVGFLFSGGFLMSGFTNGSMWANGIATSSRILDYRPGPVGSSISDPKNRLYTINSSDSPFGLKWQMWKDAVSLGANFYDGDNDGIYNPIDKNSNGQWDPNEDRPDLIGDATFWCVFNDGVPSSSRRFSDVSPQGIEVRQTVFGYSSRTSPKGNIMFIRYSIMNRGTAASVLDSVYFSVWADPDIGEYTDDLAGCDTLLKSSFLYNDGVDDDYGVNPPTFYAQVLQSPPQYLPGITFIDKNSNGLYDSGIDISLDTAYNFSGPLLGIEKIPGARNFGMTSSVPTTRIAPPLSIPQSKNDLRNYMVGRDRNGNLLNPCTYGFGVVRGGVNCASVNPVYVFSGDPVSNYGWSCNFPLDYFITTNLGPFQLQQNKPVNIIAAYIVGRGNSALNSISEARTIAQYSKSVYDGNFSLPTSVDDREVSIPNDFKLYQNYPNPFNPSTTIKFRIPHSAFVTLKVYDILGREVATLVDEVKETGVYNSTFSTLHSMLSTGVYFYELKAGDFRDVKKMVILK